MKKVILATFILVCFCTLCVFCIITIKQMFQSEQNIKNSIVFSIGDREFFKIPEDIIVKYTISEGESLFWNLDDKEVTSILDKFRLTATTAECLNSHLFKGPQITSGDSLPVNMLNGPFYLEINEKAKLIDLKIENFICYQIKYSLLSGRPFSAILEEKGTDRVTLKDNTLDHSLIGNLNSACMFSLCFKQNLFDVNEDTLVSIVPQEIVEEALFSTAKSAQCVIEVNNDDYALLVGVLRGYNSYVKLEVNQEN